MSCMRPKLSASARASRETLTSSASSWAWRSRAKQGLIVGARSVPGNPCDGDTQAAQLEQVEILTRLKPKSVIVDLGYLGKSIAGVEVLQRGKPKELTPAQ